MWTGLLLQVVLQGGLSCPTAALPTARQAFCQSRYAVNAHQHLQSTHLAHQASGLDPLEDRAQVLLPSAECN